MSDDLATARLSIGIDQPLTAAGGAGGYVGRIIDVTPGRSPNDQVREDIVIPLGQDQARTLEIKPGEYLIEAVSPSGELLDRRVSVGSGDEVVRLGQGGRLSDELGWQVVSGNIDRVRMAAETAADQGVRQAKRSVAQVRSFWRRLGWARPLLLALAILLAAVAALMWTGRQSADSSIANTMAAPEEIATASQNAVEQHDENAVAPLEMEAAAENTLSTELEAAAENFAAANGDASAPRYRWRRRAPAAQSAETNAAASAEMLPPPPPEPEGPAEANAATAAPAPSTPEVQAKAGAPEAEAPERVQQFWQLPVFWPAILIFAALLVIGFIFTRWARPRDSEAEAEDMPAPVAGETAAATAVPVTSPGAFPATLFRATPGVAAWAIVDAAEQGISAVRALIEPLTKAELPGRECEGFCMHDIVPGQLGAGGVGGGSIFALVPTAGSAGEIIGVPLPWALPDGNEAGFEIAASTSPSSSFSASSTIKDAEAATILGYMAAGRLQQAEMIVRSAEEMLNFKYRNPMAAALGAYVLISSCVSRSGGGAWRPWIGNLYADFPWLPDAAILQGWNLLQRQQGQADLERARECLIDAVERGIPIFSEGVRLLQSGLAMFGGKGAEKRLKDAIERVDKLALRCAPAQAFTTIRVSADP